MTLIVPAYGFSSAGKSRRVPPPDAARVSMSSVPPDPSLTCHSTFASRGRVSITRTGSLADVTRNFPSSRRMHFSSRASTVSGRGSSARSSSSVRSPEATSTTRTWKTARPGLDLSIDSKRSSSSA